MDFLITTTRIHFFPRSCWNSAFRARYKQTRPNFYIKTKAEACTPSVLAKGIGGLQQRRHNDGNSNENVVKCQKTKGWFRLENNSFARALHYFVHFSTVVARRRREMPNFTFCGGHEHRTTIFFFWLEQYKQRVQTIRINSRKIFQHLTNWTRRNKRDKVWNSVNSLFKWRFPSWHRRCCLSSLSISVFVPSHAMVDLRWCYTTSSPGSTRDDS